MLAACRGDGFAHVPSFRWLVTTLLELGKRGGSSHGDAVAELLIEVALRVPSVRAGESCELRSERLYVLSRLRNRLWQQGSFSGLSDRMGFDP